MKLSELKVLMKENNITCSYCLNKKEIVQLLTVKDILPESENNLWEFVHLKGICKNPQTECMQYSNR